MPFPRILVLVLLIAIWVVSAAVYGDLPDRIPQHLNGSGIADRWADKSLLVWLLMPFVATGTCALLLGIGALAPKYPALFNYPGKERVLALSPERRAPAIHHVRLMMDWVAVSIVVTMGIVQYVLYEAAMGRARPGLLFAAIGIGVLGPLAGIAVESIRVGRAVDAIRG